MIAPDAQNYSSVGGHCVMLRVLAIGIVVDDAIVVVEAVHAKLQKKKADSYTASIEGIDQFDKSILCLCPEYRLLFPRLVKYQD